MTTAADLSDGLNDIFGSYTRKCEPKGWLDTGIPELNYMIGQKYDRGAPVGKIIEIFGPASSGKTFLATQLMAETQKKGGIAFFCDHERSFDPDFAETLGMSTDPSIFRHVFPETLEDSIDTMWQAAKFVRESGLSKDTPCIWVIDSIASAIPHSKLYDEKGEVRKVGSYKMNDSLALAKSCSQGYPILKMFAEDMNFTVLLLNQIRIKPAIMFGDPMTTPGGNAAEFYADVRISLGKKDLVKGAGKDKEVVGFEIRAKCVKNKVAKPNQTASWQIRYNEGELGVNVDQVSSNLDLLIRKGLITRSGNRIDWEGKKYYPTQLAEELKKDPDGNKKLLDILFNSVV